MLIRKTEPNDIDDVMKIYEKSRKIMRESGNENQWVNGYPSREIVKNDIEKSCSYVCVNDSENEILCVFYFAVEEEPTYKEIFEGAWLNDEPYAVVHRIGSSGKIKGVGSFCLGWCFSKHPNIRIDTHADNVIMHKLMKKNGFTKCGRIVISDGTDRTAFHKISYMEGE